MMQLLFIVECGIAHFLCVVHVFEVRPSPHPLGYLYAKFHFFCDLHCCKKWEKSRVLNHSLTQLIWCPGNRSACASEL